MKPIKVILGLDPGYARLGWGVIAVRGNEYRLVDYGCIETHKGEELPQRLAIINAELEKVITQHNPDEIAIEELFFSRNVTTGLQVAHARGVIFLRAVHHCGHIYQYKPNQVKQATTGVGNADKKQMQEMVKRILNLEKIPKPDDAADALAVAITHSAYSR
ncbi:MAG: crossover junction endodeoxyribonuclease RuvC [Firmicutes bacterium]|nr:crossover junction endodeoxyribonuclease RuvC [Bacillota bacterium]